jgi:hypothetical protein
LKGKGAYIFDNCKTRGEDDDIYIGDLNTYFDFVKCKKAGIFSPFNRIIKR